MSKPLNQDEFYIQKAILASRKSHDIHSQVGCVIVSGNSFVVEANTLPEGYTPESHPDFVERPEKSYWMNHAEMAGIYSAVNASMPLKGATLYCTKFSCVDCARTILGLKIARVVLPEPDFNHVRWGEGWKRSYELLSKRTDLVCLPTTGKRGKL